MADLSVVESEFKLGRLKSFGVEEPWQVAYLLPKRFDDFSNLTNILREVPFDQTGSILVAKVISAPRFEFKKGPPRAYFNVSDGDGHVATAVMFGDTASVKEKAIVGHYLLLKGKKTLFNNEVNFSLEEIAPTHWAGKLRPVYPGKSGVISPSLVMERVVPMLDEAIPVAAKNILYRLSEIGNEKRLLDILEAAPFNSIEQILRTAHLPSTIEYAKKASDHLESLAAMDLLLRAKQESLGFAKIPPIPLSKVSLEKRIQALPYPLTSEQSKAVSEITEDLRRPIKMHRLLSGDVGTGKTAVYGTAAANAYDAGARVAIMLPNLNLAAQIFNEIKSYWPDMDCMMVSGETSKKADTESPRVVIGTTALLSRNVGTRDLLIVDEQQKFSVEQRKHLGEMGHVLEVSATCIPRSQALMQFGVMDLSMLTKGHVEKTIRTKLSYQEDRAELMDSILNSVNSGHQVAVVYPLKENQKSGDDSVSEEDNRKSAVAMYEMWEKHFPGRVRLLHGMLTDSEKQSVIADMKSDEADILISTTVIEVGLTLPRLRRLMVVNADRHGLTGLHQLRGRLARHGGEGFFDLYIPKKKNEVNAETIERLAILEETTDGFKVAEHDLFQRGHGELGGQKQSGKDCGFLFGRDIEISTFTKMTPHIPDMMMSKPDALPWAEDINTSLTNSHEEVREKRPVGVFNESEVLTGDVYRMLSGRLSSPVPNVDFVTEGKLVSSLTKLYTWYLLECLSEAEARGDSVLFEKFVDIKPDASIPLSKLNYMTSYLFDAEIASMVQAACNDRLSSEGKPVLINELDTGVMRVEPVKWFGTEERALAWIKDSKSSESFEIILNNRRYEIYETASVCNASNSADTQSQTGFECAVSEGSSELPRAKDESVDDKTSFNSLNESISVVEEMPVSLNPPSMTPETAIRDAFSQAFTGGSVLSVSYYPVCVSLPDGRSCEALVTLGEMNGSSQISNPLDAPLDLLRLSKGSLMEGEQVTVLVEHYHLTQDNKLEFKSSREATAAEIIGFKLVEFKVPDVSGEVESITKSQQRDSASEESTYDDFLGGMAKGGRASDDKGSSEKPKADTLDEWLEYDLSKSVNVNDGPDPLEITKTVGINPSVICQ